MTFRAQIPHGSDLGQRARPKSVPSAAQVGALSAAVDGVPFKQLMDAAGATNRTRFREQVVRPLLTAGLLEMTIPDKPRSSRQGYRTTPAEVELLDCGASGSTGDEGN